MDFTIFKELNKFREVQLVTDGKWKNLNLNGRRLASGTTVLSKYKYPFDPDGAIAARVAARDGVEVEVIQAKWARSGLISTEKGNALHNFIENAYAGRKVDYPATQVQALFEGEDDPVKDSYETIREQFKLFKERTKDKLIPIKSEFIVADEEYGVGGIIDQLFYNVPQDQLQIWDWKTNKDMDKTDFDNAFYKAPLDTIESSKKNEYFAQLSLYKYIIEKNTNLEIGDCYIGWFYEDNDSFKLLKAPYYGEEIEKMLIDYKANHAYNRRR